MKPVREGKIIRPLLQISRQQIEAYCREKNLKYRIDSTNEEIRLYQKPHSQCAYTLYTEEF